MNIKDFVDITISHSARSSNRVSGVRPVLFVARVPSDMATTTGALGLIDGVFTDAESILRFESGKNTVFTGTSALYLEAREFFRAGGLQIRLAFAHDVETIGSVIKKADDVINVRVIATTISGSSTSSTDSLELTASEIKDLADDINGEGNQVELGNKILFADLPIASATTMPKGLEEAKWVVAHLVNGNTDYTAAKAMAYISNQNFKRRDIKPYLYTVLNNGMVLNPTSNINETAILDAVGMGDIDKNLNYNAFMKITNGVNAVLGGKTTNGVEIVNLQNSIAVEEDLTRTLFSYLIENKPTFSTSTIAEVQNLLTDYLDKVLESGWLSPARVELDDEVRVTKNGINFNLLSQGEVLEYGYKVVILPFSRQDILERTFKDIYVFLATTKGIKKIKLEGEIL